MFSRGGGGGTHVPNTGSAAVIGRSLLSFLAGGRWGTHAEHRVGCHSREERLFLCLARDTHTEHKVGRRSREGGSATIRGKGREGEEGEEEGSFFIFSNLTAPCT